MITYEIDVLIGARAPDKKAPTVKCHDTGVNLRVNLRTSEKASKWRNVEKPYYIPEGSTVVLKIEKPDKTYVLQDGTFSGATAFFELPPQSFTASGTAFAEVNIFGIDGRRLTTDTFNIVIPKEVADDCAEDSKSYVSLMDEQIRAAIYSAERAEKAAERAEKAAGAGQVEIMEKLPEASENLHGKFLIVAGEYDDSLYICLRKDGKYSWVEFGGPAMPEIDETTAALGAAILDKLILA